MVVKGLLITEGKETVVTTGSGGHMGHSGWFLEQAGGETEMTEACYS